MSSMQVLASKAENPMDDDGIDREHCLNVPYNLLVALTELCHSYTPKQFILGAILSKCF